MHSNDNLWKVVNRFHLASERKKCERDGVHWRSLKTPRGYYTAGAKIGILFSSGKILSFTTRK